MQRFVTISFACLCLGLSAQAQKADTLPFKLPEGLSLTPPPPPPPTYDKRPTFKGGDKQLFNFIMQRLRYPATANRDRVGGEVVVLFTIQADGKLVDFAVEKGVRKDLDNEALRVCKLMPNWIPGSYQGTPMPVRYRMPLIFNPPPLAPPPPPAQGGFAVPAPAKTTAKPAPKKN